MCGVQAPSLGASDTTMLALIRVIGKRQVCKTSSQWKDALRSTARKAKVKALSVSFTGFNLGLPLRSVSAEA